MAASAVPGLFDAPRLLDGPSVQNCALGDLRGLAGAGPKERVLNINLFRGFNVPLPAGRPELVSLSLKCAHPWPSWSPLLTCTALMRLALFRFLIAPLPDLPLSPVTAGAFRS